MRKLKFLVVMGACVAFSSCGIFKEDCHCPHFGKSAGKTAFVRNVC
jgi:hypothetical protein